MTVGAVPGARCAVHPEAFAAGVCDRCGSFYCPSCAGRVEGPRSFCSSCESTMAYVPWEDRARLGKMRAFFLTIKRAVLNPQEFAREIPAEGGFGAPLGFATIATVIGVVPILLILGVVFGFVAYMISREGGMPSDAPPDWFFGAIGVFYALMLFVAPIVWMFLWAGILRLSSILLGAPRGSYQAIFRILAYSNGLNVAMAIPLLSTVALVFQVLHAIYGISAKCGVSTGRAAAIYFIPIGICICLYVGLYAALIVAAAAIGG